MMTPDSRDLPPAGGMARSVARDVVLIVDDTPANLAYLSDALG